MSYNCWRSLGGNATRRALLVTSRRDERRVVEEPVGAAGGSGGKEEGGPEPPAGGLVGGKVGEGARVGLGRGVAHLPQTRPKRDGRGGCHPVADDPERGEGLGKVGVRDVRHVRDSKVGGHPGLQATAQEGS